MPRISRKSIQSSFFHVITQGIDKSYIFDNSEDIKYYIKNIYDLQTKHSIKIIAYCIMNNHAHILVETEKIEDLSRFMQKLNTRYGMYYNKKYRRVGYVFRDRYKSEGIYDERHLCNCINYIYENPVKAGICEKAFQYPYSNYKKIENAYTGDYSFIEAYEEAEIDIEEITQKYFNKNIDEIKDNNKELKTIVKLLKDEYKISLLEISKRFNINREKIRKLYHK